MRGDFELERGGYPIAAMPTGVVKGECYVMDVTTMNKLLDARAIPTAVAVQVAGFLNRQIVDKVLEKDWVSLNDASNTRYNAIIGQFPEIVNAAQQQAESTEPENTGDAGSTEPAGTSEEDSVLAEITAAPSEASAALAAIIAEATGHTDDVGGDSAPGSLGAEPEHTGASAAPITAGDDTGAETPDVLPIIETPAVAPVVSPAPIKLPTITPVK